MNADTPRAVSSRASVVPPTAFHPCAAEVGRAEESLAAVSVGYGELPIMANTRDERPLFAVRLVDDSMLAPPGERYSFPRGAVAIIDAQRAAKCGDFVLARSAAGLDLIRQLIVAEDGRNILRPLNRAFQPCDAGELIGRVQSVQVSLDLCGVDEGARHG